MSVSLEGMHGVLATPVRHVANLFTPAAARDMPRRTELLLVVAVLALAAVVRFWELGSFSFHKPDEDTTVLAAIHILEDGTPRFPSGMFYARGIVQSYLIGGSFALFGVSEWSARLPSALCGLLVVWLAWLVSRRFLTAPWRIGFTICVALLPTMIADAQEARMYGFMVASLLGATWQVFRWEETARLRHLAWSVIWLLVGIQFQTLALLGAAILLFPGLSRGGIARTMQGFAALVLVGLGYLVISGWQNGFYPEQSRAEYFPGWSDPLLVAPAAATGAVDLLAGTALALAGGALAWLATRRTATPARWGVVGMAAAALLLQASLHYHLAGLCWLVVLILGARNGIQWRWTAMLLAGAAALAVAQAASLLAGGTGIRQALGLMVGWPSVWPALQVARSSWFATGVVALGLLLGLLRLARREPVHEIWLYFALTVWAPLLVVGASAWFVPPRYVEFALLPMLLTAFVTAATLLRGRSWLGALPVAVLAIHPPAAWTAVVEGQRYADHRAAAQFLKGLPLRDDDILVAEEVLMQHYYLGRVDYWLVSPQVAAQFVVTRNGQFVDQYTHSPFVDSVEALRRVVDEAGGRRVFVIGTSEPGSRVHDRGAELDAFLRSGALKSIYVGSDGARIWQAGGD